MFGIAGLAAPLIENMLGGALGGLFGGQGGQGAEGGQPRVPRAAKAAIITITTTTIITPTAPLKTSKWRAKILVKPSRISRKETSSAACRRRPREISTCRTASAN